jgi:hypothetical protein
MNYEYLNQLNQMDMDIDMDKSRIKKFVNQISSGIMSERQIKSVSASDGHLGNWNIQGKEKVHQVSLISQYGKTYFVCNCTNYCGKPITHCKHIMDVIVNILKNQLIEMDNAITYMDDYNEMTNMLESFSF